MGDDKKPELFFPDIPVTYDAETSVLNSHNDIAKDVYSSVTAWMRSWVGECAPKQENAVRTHMVIYKDGNYNFVPRDKCHDDIWCKHLLEVNNVDVSEKIIDVSHITFPHGSVYRNAQYITGTVIPLGSPASADDVPEKVTVSFDVYGYNELLDV